MLPSPLSLRGTKKLRAFKANLAIETLEERQLLSANSAYSYVPTDILVQLRAGAPVTQGSQVLPGTTIGPEIGLVPGLHQVTLAKGVSAEQALTAYRNYPAVQYAEMDTVVHQSAVPNDTYYAQNQWSLNNTGQTGGTYGDSIQAEAAWNVTTGSSSVIVATLDTGIDFNHPDLAANVWTNPGDSTANGVDNDNDGFVDDVHGWNFVSNNNNVMDDYFHGTHVAGIIGAVGNNGTGVTGVNWHVQIMAVKMLDSSGNGTTANAVLALNFAVAHGAKVVNISWNGGPYSQAFHDAIQNAGNKGVLIVCAAGNANSNVDANLNYPPSYNLPNMIVVAATDANDNIASFSNYGANTVSLVAPGVNILSTMPNNSYQYEDGTSMAAPQVSGAAALLLAADPSLSVADLKTRILGGTDFIGNKGDNARKPTVTSGRLDVANSLATDLSWNSLTGPASVQAGPSFTVSGGYRVTGSGAGSFTVRYYLSSDNVFGNGDETLLGAQTINGANVGTYGITSPGFSVAQGGTYTIFAQLDSATSIKEFSETNNVSTGVSLQVGTTTATGFSINNISVKEGNNGTSTAVFTVTLSKALTTLSSVKYATVNGTATAGSDYTATSGTLTFSAGQTTKTLAVTIKGDTAVEPNEIFTVQLSSPTKVGLANATGICTILNDDVGVNNTNLIGSDGSGHKAVVYPYDPTVLTGSTPGATTLISSGDDEVASFSLGTNSFNFYGVTYSSLFVSSNGLVTFGSSTAAWENTDLTSSPAQAAIAPLWDDWMSTTGFPMVISLLQDTTGDGKPDRLVLEWNNVQYSGGSPWTQTFQVDLQLNTGSTPGDIVFNYYFLDSQDNHAHGATATVGIKGPGATGSNVMLLSLDNAANPYLTSYSAIRIAQSNPFAASSSSASSIGVRFASSALDGSNQSTSVPGQLMDVSFTKDSVPDSDSSLPESPFTIGQPREERASRPVLTSSPLNGQPSAAPAPATASAIPVEEKLNVFDDLFAHDQIGDHHLPFRATGKGFVAADSWIYDNPGLPVDDGSSWHEKTL